MSVQLPACLHASAHNGAHMHVVVSSRYLLVEAYLFLPPFDLCVSFLSADGSHFSQKVLDTYCSVRVLNILVSTRIASRLVFIQ